MRVVRWKPAGLRPAALALSSRSFLLLLDDSPLDFGRIGNIALVLRTRCMDNDGASGNIHARYLVVWKSKTEETRVAPDETFSGHLNICNDEKPMRVFVRKSRN